VAPPVGWRCFRRRLEADAGFDSFCCAEPVRNISHLLKSCSVTVNVSAYILGRLTCTEYEQYFFTYLPCASYLTI